jgi:glycosyltransferase involved in cell wall biosynthesis
MNILMVHPHEVYSKIEPWTVRITNFAKEFVKKGHSVKMVYFPLEYKDKKPFFRDGIEYIPYSRKASIKLLYKHCLQLSQLAKWADIIHFQKCFHYASLPSLFSSWRLNRPIHYDWDDWEEMIYYESADPPLKLVGSFLRIIERTIPGIVDTISVSSQRLRTLCTELNIDSDAIFHVPVGVDLEKFNPSISGERVRRLYNISNPLILYLGQLHGGQYVELFIQSAKIILDKGIKVDFMIVGDGARAAELRQKAKDLKLDTKIIFTGAVDSEEVPEYIASCDVAVACFEDNEVTRCKSPLKIVEYLASGKPVVASRVGEVERMIGDAGMLVEAGKAEPLADAIIALLFSRELSINLGIKARQRAEKIYNWKASTETLLRAYQCAMQQKRILVAYERH